MDLDGSEPVSSRSELKNIRLTNNIDKGNIITGFYDPSDKLHMVDVEKVFDPIKNQAFFIHQENSTSYYWNSTESNLLIHRKADGSVESNGKWEKYETYEQQQARIGSESADMLGAFFAGGVAAIAAAPIVIAAAPTITTFAEVSATSRIVNTAIDYTSQVVGNYASGKSGSEAWVGNINLTSLVVSGLNPGTSWKKLVFNNSIASAFSVTPSEGYNGVGGGKDIKTALIQTTVGVFTGRLTRGVDLRINQLTSRLNHVNFLQGSSSPLSTSLQSAIRNTGIIGAAIGTVSGSGASTINNKVEKKE